MKSSSSTSPGWTGGSRFSIVLLLICGNRRFRPVAPDPLPSGNRSAIGRCRKRDGLHANERSKFRMKALHVLTEDLVHRTLGLTVGISGTLASRSARCDESGDPSAHARQAMVA